MTLSSQFLSHFEVLQDPRKESHLKRHLLMDILVLTILAVICGAVICGADSWVEVEEFGEEKEEWLKTFLTLMHGIPSHDTIGRVFASLSTRALEECFMKWVHSLVQVTNGEIIAIDGKTVRGSRTTKKGESPSAIHMVSAWAAQQNMVLGQRQVDEKSNEITAIPALLKMLDIKGGIVTIDAMGCQRKIATKIIDQGADYVFTVKDNQGDLHQKMIELFEKVEQKNWQDIWHKQSETVDGGHGRVETRRYSVLPVMYLPWMASQKWQGLQSLVMVERTREINDKISYEKHYYISSLKPNADIIGDAIRSHWCIENKLHWSLDVAFREDQCRVRTGNAASNFAIIRHIALNLLKNEKSSKVGIKIKRSKAGWNNTYLAKVLAASDS